MKKYIVIIFFALFCISSFLGGVHFNNFINNWDLLILTFGLLGFYLCLLENKITKELFLLLFLIILVPLIFFSGLSLIDNTLVSSINDWIGFLGAYLGVIGAIAVVWWQHIENKKQFEKQLNEEKNRRQQNISSYIKYTSEEYLNYIKNFSSNFLSLFYSTLDKENFSELSNNLLKFSLEISLENYNDILSSEKGSSFLALKKEADLLYKMLEKEILNFQDCINFSIFLSEIDVDNVNYSTEFKEKFSDFVILSTFIPTILHFSSSKQKLKFPSILNLENKKNIYCLLKSILKKNKNQEKFIIILKLTQHIQIYFSSFFLKVLIDRAFPFQNNDRANLSFIINRISTYNSFISHLLTAYNCALEIQS